MLSGEGENESDVVGIELHRVSSLIATRDTGSLSSMASMLYTLSKVRTLPGPSLDVDWQDRYRDGIIISPFPVPFVPYSSTNP